MAGWLEQSLQRYFLTLGILCDFETKGTISDDKSGSLAKMPFGGAMYPCNMKDETDYWDERQLGKFKACSVVNVRRVEQIAQGLVIDEEKAEAFAHHKRELDEKAHPEREIVAFILEAMGWPKARCHGNAHRSVSFHIPAASSKTADSRGGFGMVEGVRKI